MKKYWETYLNVFKKDYVNFQGREGQYVFVVFILFQLAAGIIFTILNQFLGNVPVVSTIIVVLNFLFGLLTILPTIAIMVRRLRDLGLSPWLMLLWILVFPGLILLIYIAIKKNR
jgi:uncharacterized membrane protein YhaH (DUF805 family)